MTRKRFLPADKPVFVSPLTPSLLTRQRETTLPNGAAAIRFLVKRVGSMKPAYDRGDLVVASSTQPVIPGCRIVVERTSGDYQLWLFRYRSPENITISAYDPPHRLIRLPIDTVRNVYAVMDTEDVVDPWQDRAPLTEYEDAFNLLRDERTAQFEAVDYADLTDRQEEAYHAERRRILFALYHSPARSLSDVCVKLRFLLDEVEGMPCSGDDEELIDAAETSLIYLERLAAHEGATD